MRILSPGKKIKPKGACGSPDPPHAGALEALDVVKGKWRRPKEITGRGHRFECWRRGSRYISLQAILARNK